MLGVHWGGGDTILLCIPKDFISVLLKQYLCSILQLLLWAKNMIFYFFNTLTHTGDPFVFGRGGEEVLEFREFGVEPTVIPVSCHLLIYMQSTLILWCPALYLNSNLM